MSRAFGNRMLKQFVVAEPDIQVIVNVYIMAPLGSDNQGFLWAMFHLVWRPVEDLHLCNYIKETSPICSFSLFKLLVF